MSGIIVVVTCFIIYRKCKTERQEVTGKPYEIRSRDLLRELGWQTLKERRDIQKATLMFNVKNKEVPENMANMFSLSNNEKYQLRSNWLNFQLDKPRTNFLKKSLVTQEQNAGTTCQIRLRQIKCRQVNSRCLSEKTVTLNRSSYINTISM